jgi:hypothetical protein
VTLLTETDPLPENRILSRRHAWSQAELDSGTHFVAGWNQLCLVYLTKVAEPGNPVALTAGFPFPPSSQDTSFTQLIEDRTDDGAFGADDVAASATC